MQDDNQVTRSSDTNADSDRVLMTKRAIFAALRDLVAERDFSSVTASEIIGRAGVSRSTFYRCFSDKYDVTNWAYKRYKNIRLQDRDKHRGFRESLRVQLDHLCDNQAFFAAALRYRGQNSLYDSMIDANEEYMTLCWRDAHGAEPPHAFRVAIGFAAAGLSHAIASWVIGGCANDPDDVVAALCDCIPEAVLETLY